MIINRHTSRALHATRTICLQSVAMCCAAGVATACWSGAASAQDEVKADEADSIATIVVTARKRGDELLQDVPQSILAFSSEQVENFGFQGLDDYVRLVPSLSFIDQGPGQSKLVLRGITTGFTRQTAIQEGETAGLYIDDTPITVNGQNPDFGLYDVERIEVLRGPQGTLYGASSMAGNIRIITKQPDATKVEGSVSTSASNTVDGDVNYGIDGVINLPLIQDVLALRMVGYHRYDDGFIDNVAPQGPLGLFDGNIQNIDALEGTAGRRNNANWQELHGGKLALKYFATENLSIGANLIWQESMLGSRFNTNEAPASPIPLGEYEQYRLVEEKVPDESRIANLTVTYDLGWGEFVSSTSSSTRTINALSDLSLLVHNNFSATGSRPRLPAGVRTPVSPVTNLSEVDDIVEEARLSGRAFDGRLNWVGGVFYSTRDRIYNQVLSSPGFEELARQRDPTFALANFGSRNLGDFNQRVEVDQQAVFGEVSFDITPALSLTGGLRWFDTEVTTSNLFKGVFQGGISENRSVSSESDVNPKFSMSYRLGDDALMFATASKGYRVGGANNPIPPTPACLADLATLGLTEGPQGFDSDTVWNYELGSKNSFLDNRMTVNVTAFHIDWSDIQTNKILGCGFTFTQNAGEATSDGAELEITLQPSRSFFMTLGGSYTDAKLKGDVPNFGARDGDNMPYLPKVSVSGMAQYSFPLAEDTDGFVSFSASYVGEMYSGFEERGIRHPSYDLGNLRFGIDRDRWKVSLFVENLWDERAATFIMPNVLRYPAGTETNRVRPRTYGLEVKVDFL
jgi:iron complex outermembrane recepter protein